MRENKKAKITDSLIFAGLLLAVSAVMLLLFYRQCTGSEALYHSDMKAYILEMQGLDSGYSFPYPVLFKLSALFHLAVSPELAVALATMVLNALSMVFTKWIFNRMTQPKNLIAGIAVSVATIAMFYLSMLFPPAGLYLPGIKFRYLGVFTPNPFHNATYLAARLFAILAFAWFVKLLGRYEEGWSRETARDYVGFGLTLLVATMTKPSFTLVMVSAAAVIMAYRLIANKFKTIVPTLQLGLAFVPTLVDLLYQYRGVFVPKEGAEGGVGFCLGEVWVQYSGNVLLSVALAVGFPLLVLILNTKDCKKNSLLRFSWQFYLVAFLEAFFLYEKGFRKFDFNFSWGYMYGIFFVHFVALAILLKKTLIKPEDKKQVALLCLQWLAFAAHLVCGLIYFKSIFAGAMYY